MAFIPSVFLQPADIACLLKYARDKECLVEIGTFLGGSACLLRAVMAPEAALYLVDPYVVMPVGQGFLQGDMFQAKAAVDINPRGLVVWMPMRGVDAARLFCRDQEASVEFLFIDGDHSYAGVKADFEAWENLVVDGGTIVFHDAVPGNGEPGCIQFTNELMQASSTVTFVEALGRCRVFRVG